MMAIAAAAAFVGLFALWVVVPKYFIQRKANQQPTVVPSTPDSAVPQAAD